MCLLVFTKALPNQVHHLSAEEGCKSARIKPSKYIIRTTDLSLKRSSAQGMDQDIYIYIVVLGKNRSLQGNLKGKCMTL